MLSFLAVCYQRLCFGRQDTCALNLLLEYKKSKLTKARMRWLLMVGIGLTFLLRSIDSSTSINVIGNCLSRPLLAFRPFSSFLLFSPAPRSSSNLHPSSVAMSPFLSSFILAFFRSSRSAPFNHTQSGKLNWLADRLADLRFIFSSLLFIQVRFAKRLFFSLIR